jgi:hypothetical protein
VRLIQIGIGDADRVVSVARFAEKADQGDTAPTDGITPPGAAHPGPAGEDPSE